MSGDLGRLGIRFVYHGGGVEYDRMAALGALNGAQWTARQLRAMSEAGHRFEIIEDKTGQIVGWAAYTFHDGETVMTELQIHPDYCNTHYRMAVLLNIESPNQYSGDKTPGGYLLDNLLNQLAHEDLERLNFSAIANRPDISDLLQRYGRDSRIVIRDRLDATENRIDYALSKLGKLTDMKWECIEMVGSDFVKVAPHTIADDADLGELYFRTTQAVQKPLLIMRTINARLGIPQKVSEVPDTEQKPGPLYLPARWIDKILASKLPPHSLAGLIGNPLTER